MALSFAGPNAYVYTDLYAQQVQQKYPQRRRDYVISTDALERELGFRPEFTPKDIEYVDTELQIRNVFPYPTVVRSVRLYDGLWKFSAYNPAFEPVAGYGPSPQIEIIF